VPDAEERKGLRTVRARVHRRDNAFRQFPKELAEVGSPGDVTFWNICFRGKVLGS